ncbi:hypothetical protein W97_00430 [Coniosporium apollinis CBS 100218]|uniref:HNH nuclease domain-containing protein n=1 Tax=Coniosporium apollinis (strain CBS 100218) TaxID=1168221 RepID=R7YH33_CONA1|nr:uncharacterized protein W97_00430 [Coniosporium apollinis CBS 100218]EON61217.1 hypothetical protein W97_00430 [Coniosporium apollinis CBS 100218]
MKDNRGSSNMRGEEFYPAPPMPHIIKAVISVIAVLWISGYICGVCWALYRYPRILGPLMPLFILLLYGQERRKVDHFIEIINPFKSRQQRPGQDDFRKSLREFYACQHEDTIWCPITKQYIPLGACKAAHILEYSFPDNMFELLFGPRGDNDTDPTMVAENGLYLYEPFESAMDSGQLVITPHVVNDKLELTAHVVDENLMSTDVRQDMNRKWRPRGLKWRDIDGTQLEFNHPTNRPGARFIYFRMLQTIIQKCIYQPPGWAYRLMEFLEPTLWTERIYVPPASYPADGAMMMLTDLIIDRRVFGLSALSLPPVLKGEDDVEAGEDSSVEDGVKKQGVEEEEDAMELLDDFVAFDSSCFD